jgi:protein kinase-like protein/TIR domain-containing protein/globin
MTDPVRVFVSYAHADRAVQRAFESQLKAAETQGAFEYWDDTRLEPGEDWGSRIRAQIAMADMALLLVSTSFLSSSYCTGVEVPALLGQRRKIFWVNVDACPWELSLLARYQACAMLDGMDEVQLRSAAKQVVLQIAGEAREVERQRSPARTFLSQCLPERARSFTDFEELRGGRHCWIQRAQAVLDDSAAPEPVVIKVLLKNPFENLAGPFRVAAERAGRLRHPTFIRLRSHYLEGRFPVLVMEGIRQRALRDVLRDDGPFRPDAVRDLIATAGEALAELHDSDGTYGVLTSYNVFVDQRTRNLRFSALSITGLLSQMRGWKEFLGSDPDAADYLIPEQFANQPLSPYSDQYVLGQIAIEMLTGRQPPPSHIESPLDLARKSEFFASPLEAITDPWIRYHPGLAAALARLLHADPQQRFSTMAEAVQELRSVDDETTAYARYAYDLACRQPGFFDAFYSAFFTACPEARGEFMRIHGEQHAERMGKQATALQYALVTALASPKALKKNMAHLGPMHRTIAPQLFTAFAETFVATLKNQVEPLPEFVLEASAGVLKQAAEHIAPRSGSGGPRP